MDKKELIKNLEAKIKNTPNECIKKVFEDKLKLLRDNKVILK